MLFTQQDREQSQSEQPEDTKLAIGGAICAGIVMYTAYTVIKGQKSKK